MNDLHWFWLNYIVPVLVGLTVLVVSGLTVWSYRRIRRWVRHRRQHKAATISTGRDNRVEPKRGRPRAGAP